MISPAELEELKEAVKSELGKGKIIDTLKSEMKEVGYEESDIEAALSGIKAESTPKINEKPTPELAVKEETSTITIPEEKPSEPVIETKPETPPEKTESVEVALEKELKARKETKPREKFFDLMREDQKEVTITSESENAPESEEEPKAPKIKREPSSKKHIILIVIVTIVVILVMLYSMGFLEGFLGALTDGGGDYGEIVPGINGFGAVKPTGWECSGGTLILDIFNGAGEQITALTANGLTCIPHAIAANGESTCIVANAPGCEGVAPGERFESSVTLGYAIADDTRETIGTIWGPAE